MSYSLDANLLLYASDTSSAENPQARAFLERCANDGDLLCLTWPTIMAYLRIATHPSIFSSPLEPGQAWENIEALISRPRTRVIGEETGFAGEFHSTCSGLIVRGNLVPDAHIATILRQHGVRRLYSADADFLKFGFLEVINPLRLKKQT